MKKAIFFLAILSMVFFLAGDSFAFEFITPLSESVIIDQNLKILYDQTASDKDEHFWAAINRLNITAQKGDFLYGLRYDVEAYFEKEEYSLKYVPEKFFFQIDKRYWDLRVGDFYSSLGKGLVLAVLKNDPFGEDQTIQGAIANFKSDYFTFRALGGLVNESDSLDFQPERAQHGEKEYEDRDLLFGGGLTTGHPTYFVIGGNYIRGELKVPEDVEFPQYEAEDTVSLISGTIASPDFIYGSFFGEYAWLVFEDRKEIIDDVEYEGRGAYSTLSLFYGPVTLLAEYQDYYRFDFDYHEAPNLEYTKTAFSHAPRTDDIIGYKFSLDFVVPKIDTILYGAYFNSQTHQDAQFPESLKDHYSGENYMDWIEHGYGGFEQTFSNTAFIFGAGGYREIPEGRWAHGELDAGMPIVSHHQISASFHGKHFSGFKEFGDEYSSWKYILEYAFSPWMIITAVYESSDEPLSGGFGEEAGKEEEKDTNFYSGQVTVEPHEKVRLTLFYGREKGGLQCAGGVCRTVPPFEGGRMDVQLRF